MSMCLPLKTPSALGVGFNAFCACHVEIERERRPNVVKVLMPPSRRDVIALLYVKALVSFLLTFDPVDDGNVHHGFTGPDHAGDGFCYRTAIGNDVVKPAFAAVVLTNCIRADKTCSLTWL